MVFWKQPQQMWWSGHFQKHLNTQFPRDDSILNTIPEPAAADSPSTPFTIDEVEEAIKSLKNNKACGYDTIAAETLKAGGLPMRQLLLKIINLAWSHGKIPEDWSKDW